MFIILRKLNSKCPGNRYLERAFVRISRPSDWRVKSISNTVESARPTKHDIHRQLLLNSILRLDANMSANSKPRNAVVFSVKTHTKTHNGDISCMCDKNTVFIPGTWCLCNTELGHSAANESRRKWTGWKTLANHSTANETRSWRTPWRTWLCECMCTDRWYICLSL